MSAPVGVLGVLDEAIEDCAWLRKNSTKTVEVTPEQLRIVRAAVAELIKQRDAYENALHLIAYGDQRPGHIDYLSKSRMAEIARAALARCGGAK